MRELGFADRRSPPARPRDLGHRSITSTAVYAALAPSRLDSKRSPKLHRRTGNCAPYFDMQEHEAWRNAEIYARRCSGLTLTAIAREFQLSRETVREIARRMERKARWCAAQLPGELNEAASVGRPKRAAPDRNQCG
jgi:lambda repressor-like predicted transcriptional regulator